MSDSTLEEARRCPACNEPGLANGTRPAPERWQGTLHLFKCVNQRCLKVDRTWIVQIRPDGTIPEATLNREKNYPMIEGMPTRERINRARASVDDNVRQQRAKNA